MNLTLLMRSSNRALSIVGCANDLAGRVAGSRMAAATLKKSEILRSSGIAHRWEKIIHQKASEPQRRSRVLETVNDYCKTLALATKNIIENYEDLLVIGGDHSCAMGTWSGVAKAIQPHGSLGLIWVDAHMDSHTPTTSHTGNIHGMPVAHLLGHGNAQLSTLLEMTPKVQPKNLVMVGIRSFESEERALLEKLKVQIYYDKEVQQRGMETVMREAIEIANDGTHGYGISVDLDAFRAEDAPAVAVPEGDLRADEFLNAIESLDLRRLLALEIVEFLPKFDTAHRTTERLAVSILSNIFANKWKQLENGDVTEHHSAADHNLSKSYMF